VKVSQIDDSKPVNDIHIALSGQWSPDASTYKCDYLHPAFFNSLFSHVVCVISSTVSIRASACVTECGRNVWRAGVGRATLSDPGLRGRACSRHSETSAAAARAP